MAHANPDAGKSPVLRTLYPNEAYIEINPIDGGELENSSTGQPVCVPITGRGEVHRVTGVRDLPRLRRGQAFRRALAKSPTSLTLSSIFDPHSGPTELQRLRRSK